MARRAAVAATVFATALAATVFTGPATADGKDDYCETALPNAGAMSGYVGLGDQEDWWRQPAPAGLYLVTVTSGPGAVAFTAGDGACAAVCGGGAERLPYVAHCEARTSDGWLTVGIHALTGDPTSYVATAKLILPATTACNDRIDNDGDGPFDFPSDAGCSSYADTTEDDLPPCVATRAGDVCVNLTPGRFLKSYTVDKPHGTNDIVEASAYLQEYRFGPTDKVGVPCLILATDPASVNPCRTAGGRPAGGRKTLFHLSPDSPDPAHTRAETVRICEHELTVTVAGAPIGPTVRLLSPCDAGPLRD